LLCCASSRAWVFNPFRVHRRNIAFSLVRHFHAGRPYEEQVCGREAGNPETERRGRALKARRQGWNSRPRARGLAEAQGFSRSWRYEELRQRARHLSLMTARILRVRHAHGPGSFSGREAYSRDAIGSRGRSRKVTITIDQEGAWRGHLPPVRRSKMKGVRPRRRVR
jgi:hypothetical protein